MTPAAELWLQADVIIDGEPQPLFAAQVPLGRFHRNMPQEELDLLKLPASRVAEPRAGTPAVVRRQLGSADGVGKAFHHVPDHLLRDARAPNRSLSADATENPALDDRN